MTQRNADEFDRGSVRDKTEKGAVWPTASFQLCQVKAKPTSKPKITWHLPTEWLLFTGREVTWTEGLQEPGAARPARWAGLRLGWAEGTDGLHISLVVASGGDLQYWDDGALVQHAVRGHHLGVALLTATHTRLEQEVGGFEQIFEVAPQGGRNSELSIYFIEAFYKVSTLEKETQSTLEDRLMSRFFILKNESQKSQQSI